MYKTICMSVSIYLSYHIYLSMYRSHSIDLALSTGQRGKEKAIQGVFFLPFLLLLPLAFVFVVRIVECCSRVLGVWFIHKEDEDALTWGSRRLDGRYHSGRTSCHGVVWMHRCMFSYTRTCEFSTCVRSALPWGHVCLPIW